MHQNCTRLINQRQHGQEESEESEEPAFSRKRI